MIAPGTTWTTAEAPKQTIIQRRTPERGVTGRRHRRGDHEPGPGDDGQHAEVGDGRVHVVGAWK